jgi:hypothetical protein
MMEEEHGEREDQGMKACRVTGGADEQFLSNSDLAGNGAGGERKKSSTLNPFSAMHHSASS